MLRILIASISILATTFPAWPATMDDVYRKIEMQEDWKYVYNTAISIDGEERAEAEYYIAKFHLGGLGTEKNKSKYSEYINKSANGGYWLSLLELSQDYYYGIGVPKDDRIASLHYKKAAASVSFEQIPRRAHLLFSDRLEIFHGEHAFLGSSNDGEEKFFLTRYFSFIKDDPSHKAFLDGLKSEFDALFPEGRIVLTQDPIKGDFLVLHLKNEHYWSLYDKAVINNDKDAAYKLGRITHFDRDVTLKWYLLATNNGHVDAPYQAGMNVKSGGFLPIHADAAAVKANLELALSYFKIAADRGSEQARIKFAETKMEIDALPMIEHNNKTPNQGSIISEIDNLIRGKSFDFEDDNIPFLAGIGLDLLDRCRLPEDSLDRVDVYNFGLKVTVGSAFATPEIGLGKILEIRAIVEAGAAFSKTLECSDPAASKLADAVAKEINQK